MPLIIGILGLAIVAAYLFTLEPLFTAQIIDLAITQGKQELLLGLVLSIVFAVVGFGIINFVNSYARAR
jgi:ABC-type bacteriocin/lantibiotic exporter with double-glycine peptidase domain